MDEITDKVLSDLLGPLENLVNLEKPGPLDKPGQKVHNRISYKVTDSRTTYSRTNKHIHALVFGSSLID